MRVELSPQIVPQRGGEVVVGNVYANNRPPAFKNFRIVVGLANKRRQNWNSVICIHVDEEGDVVGCSANPAEYVKNHWDLIGKVQEMPSMKINWLERRL